MEQQLPVVAKKFWNLVRVAIFMLKQGISNSKLLADLNIMLKRGKLAGKAIQNLMFHHTHIWAAASSSSTTPGIQRSPDHQLPFTPKPDEYEFSCSPSPDNRPHGINFHLPFHIGRRKNPRTNAPPQEEVQFEAAKGIMRAIEMLKSETASPGLPGFGKSPVVRQLRITDSPFPINYDGNDEEKHVDEDADQFIKRFYKDLRKQNRIAWGTPGR